MSKIGILTYHHVVNWGSVLQTYCLQSFLNKLHPKSQIEIINYIPKTSFNYSQKRLYPVPKKHFWQKPSKENSYLKKYNVCQDFLKQYCQLSPMSLCSDSIEEGKEFIAKQQYDTVFVGSDTVFQLSSNFGNQYISAPQAPNMYFLPFVASFKKIGFAVSVNPFDLSMLNNLDVEKTRECLEDFQVIFYRDQVTKQALELLGVKHPKMEFMPDPSLLVDFDLLTHSSGNQNSENKLAAVAIGNGKIAQEIVTTLKIKGYTTINLLSGANTDDAKKLEEIDSMEKYLAIHRQFNLVITDRFHGSIITLVMGDCPVIGIEEVQRYPQPNSKLRDLYDRLGIEMMIFRYQDQVLDSNWLNSYLEKWNFSKQEIMSKILNLRLDSLAKISFISNYL